jgi:membrane protease YdiL (CAAX protease family)
VGFIILAPMEKRWKRILLFLVIAITISNIFRFDVFDLKANLEEIPSWIYILTTIILEGSGVLIGALIALFLLKKKRITKISLFGTSKSKSLVTIIGVDNEVELNPHLYGFISIIGTLLYCVMEEYGWRGYLQEELKTIKPWKKYLTIGFLWYFWHLTFLTEATIGDNLFFLAMMIFGSWGIGQVVESTKSILASACFHLIIQIMMFNALIKNGIDMTEKLIILVVSVVLWFMIIKKWEKEELVKKVRN